MKRFCFILALFIVLCAVGAYSEWEQQGGPPGSGSMTWPSGGAGIPNYNGSSGYGTSYNASNPIPSNFLPSVLTNPMTTAGDMILGGANGAPTRVGIGANNSIWCANSGGTVGWCTSFNLSDSTVFFNAADNTKQLILSLSGISTGTEITMTLPNYSFTPASLSGSENLTNKTTTTQSAGDNSTKLATTAYVDRLNPVVTSANGGSITAINSYNITTGTTTWTLPPTTAGDQACFRQADGATNAITITPPSSSYVEASNGSAYCTVSHAIKSGGANGDSICYVAIDSTHWMVFGGVTGTWTCQ